MGKLCSCADSSWVSTAQYATSVCRTCTHSKSPHGGNPVHTVHLNVRGESTVMSLYNMPTLTVGVKTNHVTNTHACSTWAKDSSGILKTHIIHSLNWGILVLPLVILCTGYCNTMMLMARTLQEWGWWLLHVLLHCYMCLWAVFTDTYLHASLFCGCVFDFAILLWVVGWVPRAGSEWVSRDLHGDRETGEEALI